MVIRVQYFLSGNHLPSGISSNCLTYGISVSVCLCFMLSSET
jgi:hypothetical protein